MRLKNPGFYIFLMAAGGLNLYLEHVAILNILKYLDLKKNFFQVYVRIWNIDGLHDFSYITNFGNKIINIIFEYCLRGLGKKNCIVIICKFGGLFIHFFMNILDISRYSVTQKFFSKHIYHSPKSMILNNNEIVFWLSNS